MRYVTQVQSGQVSASPLVQCTSQVIIVHQLSQVIANISGHPPVKVDIGAV